MGRDLHAALRLMTRRPVRIPRPESIMTPTDVLREIARCLVGIDNDDYTTAERNIMALLQAARIVRRNANGTYSLASSRGTSTNGNPGGYDYHKDRP